MLRRPTPEAELNPLRTIELMALRELGRGLATDADLRTLGTMTRISQALARAGIGPEVVPMLDAVGAMQYVWHGEGWGAEPATIEALVCVLDAYDEQRRLATQAEYERAIWRAKHGYAP
jgi:hypothetical protein